MKTRFQKLGALLIVGTLCFTTACSGTTSSVNTETTASADNKNTTSTTSESSADAAEKDVDPDSYEAKLFDTSYVHTIDVEISEEDWADLLENPTEKTKYEVNVTIDGETINSVSIATKGNTSLSSIASDDTTDRYSFKINFRKYVDDQTYYGLDKLNLNNIYADSTYIKDYLSYQLFNYMGVDAPLTSFVNVTINGEPWGLYLAIEDVADSFLERTDNSEGELYKPETSMLAGMGEGGKDMPEGFDPENMEMPEGFDPENMEMPEGFDPENMKTPEGFNASERPDKDSDKNTDAKETTTTEGENKDNNKDSFKGFGGGPGGFEGFGGNDSGASLKYTDDEIDSYSDIFDNAETDVTEEDEVRLIEALKNLSEGNIEESVNIDSVINYFVVHNFVLNYDSYTGNMLHNYYLYEEDGVLQMIPWDYNLAYGGFMNMGGGPGNRSNDNENKDNTDSNGSNNNDTNHAPEGFNPENIEIPEGFNPENMEAPEGFSPENMPEGMDFAGFGGNSATDIVNYGIDSPLSGATEDDRPMWAWIVNNEEYLEKYHESFAKLSNYILSDEFQAELDRLYEMLLPYVENDATAFYTVDEFKTGFNTIKEFVTLRAQSIEKQLSGELSTVANDQNAESKIDASSISINDMGSQGGGGDHGGPDEDRKDRKSEKSDNKSDSENTENTESEKKDN